MCLAPAQFDEVALAVNAMGTGPDKVIVLAYSEGLATLRVWTLVQTRTATEISITHQLGELMPFRAFTISSNSA